MGCGKAGRCGDSGEGDLWGGHGSGRPIRNGREVEVKELEGEDRMGLVQTVDLEGYRRFLGRWV